MVAAGDHETAPESGNLAVRKEGSTGFWGTGILPVPVVL